MKVLKFGGTSVGSPENMRSVMEIITDGEQKIVVLSAMSGTTNALVEISGLLKKKNYELAATQIGTLEDNYKSVVNELLSNDQLKEEGLKVVETSFDAIKSFLSGKFSKSAENTIVAQGELISTGLFTLLM